jgi:Delta24-sterol reductase
MKTSITHQEKVSKIAQLLKDYLKTGDKRKIRFDHGSTNSTRVQDKSGNYVIDISSLNQILEIDEKHRFAVIEPNVSMDTLVDECLKFDLLPKVVPEFPAITCGGAVNGAALEASSFKFGQFNDNCLEYECILGDGTIINVSKDKNSDLFYGISGSYGSLALLTAITISLIPAKPYLSVSFLKISTKNVLTELNRLIQENQNDYLDAIIFSNQESVIVSAKFTNDKIYPKVTFSKASDEWFYLYAKQSLKKDSPISISVPLKDFLFRYDRGAFWMGKHAFNIFHTPFNRLTRSLLNPFMPTKIMYKALHRSNLAQNLFIQDFYIPNSATNSFIDFAINNLQIFPLWLCPVKSTSTSQILSPHYLKEDLLIDVGVWGSIARNLDITEINRMLEDYAAKLGGRKMLYAQSFYTKDTFWKIYDQKAYDKLRNKYKASGVLPDIWEKTYVKKKYPIHKWRGAITTMIEAVIKHQTK